MELTAEIAKELLTYNPYTGKLYWKERPAKYFKNLKRVACFNSRHTGKETFRDHTPYHKESDKYRLRGVIFRKKYYAHRIAWLMYYGEWPKNYIDHINQDSTDNRIKNLRDVTNAENHKNISLYKNNKTGYIGVDIYKNKYRARIRVDGIRKSLGVYDTAEEAAVARKIASINHNFHPNHGNSKGI